MPFTSVIFLKLEIYSSNINPILTSLLSSTTNTSTYDLKPECTSVCNVFLIGGSRLLGWFRRGCRGRWRAWFRRSWFSGVVWRSRRPSPWSNNGCSKGVAEKNNENGDMKDEPKKLHSDGLSVIIYYGENWLELGEVTYVCFDWQVPDISSLLGLYSWLVIETGWRSTLHWWVFLSSSLIPPYPQQCRSGSVIKFR